MEGIYDGLPGGDDVSCDGKPFTAATLVPAFQWQGSPTSALLPGAADIRTD